VWHQQAPPNGYIEQVKLLVLQCPHGHRYESINSAFDIRTLGGIWRCLACAVDCDLTK
jgi:hypothetical protein